MEKLEIVQGSTFEQPVRWGTTPIIYKPITAPIVQQAPVQIPCTGHGIPDGWKVEVVSVQGMTEINSTGKGKPTDYHQATVKSADLIELNDVNASEFSAYVSGGYIKFYTPVDLTGYTARMDIKDKIGGTVLVSLTSDLNGGIVIDTATHTIMLQLTATQTAAFTWTKGVCDLELVKDGKVVKIMTASVIVKQEVTT